MKTLDTDQEPLIRSAARSLIDLVVITTYSERAAEVVSETYRFAAGHFTYDYGNTGNDRQFEPFLLGIDEAQDTMTHLPSAPETRKRSIRLRNGDRAGEQLWKTLVGDNIEFARVEISQLSFLGTDPTRFSDGTALTGDEHTVLFRGVVTKVAVVTEDEIGLACEAEWPQIPWLVASDATINDPQDLGRRLPVVYGSMPRVPAVGWEVGAITTLAVAIDVDDTTITVTDGTNFPTSGSMRINSEEISWTAKTSTHVLGSGGSPATRGASSTTALPHAIGELCVETVAPTFIVAGHESDAVSEVYIRSPFNFALVRVDSSLYTADVADTTTVATETVTSIKFTQANLRILLDALRDQATETTGETTAQETRLPNDVDSIGGDQEATMDNNLETYFQYTSSTAIGYTWDAVTDRVLTEVTYEVYATLDDTDIILFRWPTSGTTPNVHNITNDSGSTRTTWWAWTTDTDNYMGEFMAVGSQATNEVRNVRRVETYSSGPRIMSETRVPTAQVGTGTASTWAKLVDGNTEWTHWAHTGVASAFGFQWAASPGRSLFAVTYRVAAMMTDGSSLVFRRAQSGSNEWTLPNNTGISTSISWFEWTTTDAGDMGTDFYIGGASTVDIYQVQRIEHWLEEPSTAIKAASVGNGLRIFADVDGFDVPAADTTYEVAAGVLIEKPVDIVRHLLQEFCGLTSAAIDDTSFTAANTNLGSNVHACILSDLGDELQDILGALSWEFRANVIQVEGATTTQYKMFAAESDHEWPVAARTLTEWMEVENQGLDPIQNQTRFRFPYAYDAGQATYPALVRIDAEQNDVSDPSTAELEGAEDRFGRTRRRRHASPGIAGAGHRRERGSVLRTRGHPPRQRARGAQRART